MQAKSAENRKTPLRLRNPKKFGGQKAPRFDLLNSGIWCPLWRRCGFVSLHLYFLHKYDALTRKLIRPVHPKTSQGEIPIIARLKKTIMRTCGCRVYTQVIGEVSSPTFLWPPVSVHLADGWARNKVWVTPGDPILPWSLPTKSTVRCNKEATKPPGSVLVVYTFSLSLYMHTFVAENCTKISLN